VLLVVSTGTGAAQVDDHLKCYKVKDSQSLRGLVDIETPQFGLEAGCKISRTLFFCVPASKDVVEAEVDRTPIDPLPIFGPAAPGDRICYKIQCEGASPPDQQVSDQFGNRQLTSLIPSLLCTPALKGPAPVCGDQRLDSGEECDPPGTVCDAAGRLCDANCQCPDPVCGDGILDPGEECDGTDAEACPGECRPTCECSLCGSALAPMCDGPCPFAGEACIDLGTTGSCECVRVGDECGFIGVPQCYGLCPAGDFCVPAGAGCACFSPND
jgi:hypothetical protein